MSDLVAGLVALGGAIIFFMGLTGGFAAITLIPGVSLPGYTKDTAKPFPGKVS